MHSRTPKKSTVKAAAAYVPQAPGVLQINLLDRTRPAWFVTTGVIPKGSTVFAYVVPPGDTYLSLGPLVVDEDIPPGRSFALPSLADVGTFWPAGVNTYDVVVEINGVSMHCAADFTTGGQRNYDDLGVVVPLIYGWSEDISKRHIQLTIQGEFTDDPVSLVLEDLAVPDHAISKNGNVVVVDLSQVPGLALDRYQNLLLTVAQGGWADTRVFTHVPFNPNNYDPAPALE